jgi:hypothetical protein
MPELQHALEPPHGLGRAAGAGQFGGEIVEETDPVGGR